MAVLEAADFDPLEAQKMEEQLTERWWKYYMVYHKEYSKVLKAQERKLKRGNQ